MCWFSSTKKGAGVGKASFFYLESLANIQLTAKRKNMMIIPK
jgi:hypothetical protein